MNLALLGQDCDGRGRECTRDEIGLRGHQRIIIQNQQEPCFCMLLLLFAAMRARNLGFKKNLKLHTCGVILENNLRK